MSGAANEAQSIANDLEKRYPEDTSVRFNYVSSNSRAAFVEPQWFVKAIDELQRSVPYELGLPRSAQTGFFGSLYPIYVRGLAYLWAHNGGEAAREFQTILDHRSVMIGDPVVNLAYLAVHALLRSQEIKRRPAGGATVIDDRQTIVLSRVSTSTGIFLSGGSKLKGGHPAVYSAGDVTSASEKRDSSPPRRLAPTTFASFAGAHL